MGEVLDRLLKLARVRCEVRYRPELLRDAETSVLQANAAKARRELDWSPRIPLDQKQSGPPGMLLTTMPSSFAVAKSIASVPMPHTVIMRRCGSCRRTYPGHFTEPRELMRQTASWQRRISSSVDSGRSVNNRISP